MESSSKKEITEDKINEKKEDLDFMDIIQKEQIFTTKISEIKEGK